MDIIKRDAQKSQLSSAFSWATTIAYLGTLWAGASLIRSKCATSQEASNYVAPFLDVHERLMLHRTV